jgi:hypothetical protein
MGSFKSMFSNYEVNNGIVAGTFLGLFFILFVDMFMIGYFESIELTYNINLVVITVLILLLPILRLARKFYFQVFKTKFFSLSTIDGFLSVASPILILTNIFLKLEAGWEPVGFSMNTIIGYSVAITLFFWLFLFFKAFIDGKYSLKKRQPSFLYVLDTMVLIIFGISYLFFNVLI